MEPKYENKNVNKNFNTRMFTTERKVYGYVVGFYTTYFFRNVSVQTEKFNRSSVSFVYISFGAI